MAAKNIRNLALKLESLQQEIPIYSIKYAENTHPVIGFSKKYDDEFNQKSEFAAIMTCSQADGGCPLLLALKAYSITYEDRKHLTTHLNKLRNIKNAVYKLQPKCYMYFPK
jgi:arsenate reductase